MTDSDIRELRDHIKILDEKVDQQTVQIERARGAVWLLVLIVSLLAGLAAFLHK